MRRLELTGGLDDGDFAPACTRGPRVLVRAAELP